MRRFAVAVVAVTVAAGCGRIGYEPAAAGAEGGDGTVALPVADGGGAASECGAFELPRCPNIRFIDGGQSVQDRCDTGAYVFRLETSSDGVFGVEALARDFEPRLTVTSGSCREPELAQCALGAAGTARLEVSLAAREGVIITLDDAEAGVCGEFELIVSRVR